jgi:hypothetical protein
LAWRSALADERENRLFRRESSNQSTANLGFPRDWPLDFWGASIRANIRSIPGAPEFDLATVGSINDTTAPFSRYSPASAPVGVSFALQFLVLVGNLAMPPVRQSSPYGRRFIAPLAAACLATALGCAPMGPMVDPYCSPAPPFVQPYAVANPIHVPVAEREFVWQQLIDVVDDHFRIQREERVHVIGDAATDGRIETYPIIGSTVFEPHRSDSASPYEKDLATLQSIQRQATVRVTPDAGGYLVEVEVIKSLEDLSQSDPTSSDRPSLRHDNSLRRNIGRDKSRPAPRQWIPVGRDAALEQLILADFQARLGLPPNLASPVPIRLPSVMPVPQSEPTADTPWPSPTTPGD